MTVDLSSGSWPNRISELKKQTLELRATRQKVAKELKAAQRKNKRLKERARSLSEEDMLQILVMKRSRGTDTGSSDAAGSSTPGSTGSAASTPIPAGSEFMVTVAPPVETEVGAAGVRAEIGLDA